MRNPFTKSAGFFIFLYQNAAHSLTVSGAALSKAGSLSGKNISVRHEIISAHWEKGPWK